jgi:hypothetical protein
VAIPPALEIDATDLTFPTTPQLLSIDEEDILDENIH